MLITAITRLGLPGGATRGPRQSWVVSALRTRRGFCHTPFYGALVFKPIGCEEEEAGRESLPEGSRLEWVLLTPHQICQPAVVPSVEKTPLSPPPPGTSRRRAVQKAGPSLKSLPASPCPMHSPGSTHRGHPPGTPRSALLLKHPLKIPAGASIRRPAVVRLSKLHAGLSPSTGNGWVTSEGRGLTAPVVTPAGCGSRTFCPFTYDLSPASCLPFPTACPMGLGLLTETASPAPTGAVWRQISV